MSNNSLITAAAVCACALALGIVVRINQVKQGFSRVVEDSRITAGGYDQSYIDMVERLERTLATRASFGFKGGKDPMTGQIRRIVPAAPTTKGMRSAPPPTPGEPAPTHAPAPPPESRDPVCLTAVIFDDSQGKNAAVIMADERSYSVEVGDKVANRRVTRITSDIVVMQDDTFEYRYATNGKTTKRRR